MLLSVVNYVDAIGIRMELMMECNKIIACLLKKKLLRKLLLFKAMGMGNSNNLMFNTGNNHICNLKDMEELTRINLLGMELLLLFNTDNIRSNHNTVINTYLIHMDRFLIINNQIRINTKLIEY